MKMAGLSIKNASGNLRHTMALGFFIFAAVFILILSDIFVSTARNKVENVLTNGYCGHIQIRSDGSREGDMAAQYQHKWDALKPIDADKITKVEGIIENKLPDVTAIKLVRRSAALRKEDKSLDTMLLGIPPEMETYREAFILSKGRYLDTERDNEILLTEEQASLLGVGIDDTVGVATKNRYGLNEECELRVAGIGNFVMLSLFSFNANYTTYDTVQELAAYSDEEATDIVLLLSDKLTTDHTVKVLAAEMERQGLEYSVSSDEKLTSEDLKVSDMSFEDNVSDKEGLRLSTHKEMGEDFKAVGDAMFIAVNILTVVLMIIVSTLIINLVYMTGIERYREIGTLRAVGFSRCQVIRIFMTEILTVSTASSVLGALLCTGLAMLGSVFSIRTPVPFLRYIIGETLQLDTDPAGIMMNLAVILVFSAVSSFIPAFRACSVDPAEAMRTV